MPNLFTLRPAREADLTFLNSYNYTEGMDSLDGIEGVTVAANSSDEPVGFIRIAIGSSGNAFVNPVVVHKSWRGYDVGRALMDHALREHGELRLVSRGSSVGFYEAIGYVPCEWSEIDEGVSEDCDGCSWRDECGPVPMRSPIQAAANVNIRE